MNEGFRARLKARQEAANTLLCVGLDPLVEKIPPKYRQHGDISLNDENAMTRWMIDVVDQTAEYACMFKPQRAHWESIKGVGGFGCDGPGAMRTVIKHIHKNYPDIPVFLDCKRGDIDRTQRQYREAHFTLDGVDGMNYNGYMGSDTLKELIDPKFPGRALVGLGRTSNPAAWKVQDRLLADGRKNWEATVQDILDWSREFDVLADAGVVMGAAHKDPNDPGKIYSGHLTRAREIVGDDLWLLIPGMGTQGGAVEETVKASYAGPGSMAINSSSQIINSGDPGTTAMMSRDEINKFIPRHWD